MKEKKLKVLETSELSAQSLLRAKPPTTSEAAAGSTKPEKFQKRFCRKKRTVQGSAEDAAQHHTNGVERLALLSTNSETNVKKGTPCPRL